MIGRQLSHYRIISELGAGGMGTVFRAEDTLLGRPVALKFPRPELVRDADARERFLREARAASALDHPHVVTLYEVCQVDEEIFLAMQCVEGSSLRQRLAGGPLPFADAMVIGRAVADALAHAHARGVVHRDIKPENILLAEDGRVKVADFGTARILTDARLTMTGIVLGTAGYLAPEVLRGEAAGPSSDLFALGVVLHEMAAGKPPFGGGDFLGVSYRVAHEEAPPLPESLPEPFRRLVARLLAKQPADRPAGAVAVADDLLTLSEPRRAGARAGDSLPERSIAVLYFQNLSDERANDYFCEGMAEDLLTELLTIPDLKVASRSSLSAWRDRSVDLRRLGADLDVATVLEGGVRRAGERIRVTARLVRTDTGFPLWSGRYDRDVQDVFAVQEDIARQIATALRVALAPSTVAEGTGFGPFGTGEGIAAGEVHAARTAEQVRLARRTWNPRAYDLRLQALVRYYRFEETEMRRAIDLLEGALREDPEYVLARAELAECCVQMVCKHWDLDPMWLDRAQREADAVLAVAPFLPEGYRASGHVYNHRRDPERALRDFHRAVELDPRFVNGLIGLSVTYLLLGDASRAEVYNRRAQELDPRDARPPVNLAVLLYRQRRLVECREVLGNLLAIEMPRQFQFTAWAYEIYSCVLLEDGAGVLRAAEEVRRRFGEDDRRGGALLAFAAAVRGDPAEAERLIARVEESTWREVEPLMDVARANVLLDRPDRALAALERASKLDVLDMGEIEADPQLARLTSDPRFAAIRREQYPTRSGPARASTR